MKDWFGWGALGLVAFLLISGFAPPIARLMAFEATPLRGFAPLKVRFQNRPLFNNTAASAWWDFGDGSAPESGNTVTHRYTRPGAYTVTLSYGGDQSQQTIRVLGFSDPTFQKTGDHPVAIAVADFNEDQFPDLLIANEFAHTVALLLGQESGLAPPISIPVGQFPLGLVTADWNADGHTDVAVVNTGSNDLTILYGNGAFFDATTLPVGLRPTSALAEDLNGDGMVDLAIAFDFDKIETLLGDNHGHFVRAVQRSLPQGPAALAGADLDRDGHTDLLSVNRDSNTLSVRYGDGAGGFARQADLAVGLNPKSLTMGDFNADGWLDVAVANWIQNSISVLINMRGHLQPQTPLRALAGPFTITSGDLDNDGVLDLVAANLEGKAVAVYLGEGNGRFATPVNLSVPDQPVGLALFDFDKDGALDIGVTSLGTNQLSLLHNQLNLTLP